MSPTRDWATQFLGTPLGSRDSDEIDDAIRELKVDLNERLPGIVKDVNAFPWQPNIVPGLVTQIIRYPWHIGWIQTSGTVVYGPNYVSIADAGLTSKVWMPVPVLVGFRITKIAFRWMRNGLTAGMTGELFKTYASGTSIANPGNVNHSLITGLGTWDTRNIALDPGEPILPGETPFAIVTLVNGGGGGNVAHFMDMEVTAVLGLTP